MLGSLVGPPAADETPGAPISSKAMIFNPEVSGPVSVSLPAPAVSLFQANGSLAALTAGTPPQLLLGSATSRTPGDAGLALFDLGNQTFTNLPVPDGFSSMVLLDVFTTTRKLVARGIRAGNSGSQFLIFDLAGANLTVVPNPDGVAFVGPVPAQAGPAAGGGQVAAPAQIVTGNLKANTVAAVALDRAGKQVGVVVVRIP